MISSWRGHQLTTRTHFSECHLIKCGCPTSRRDDESSKCTRRTTESAPQKPQCNAISTCPSTIQNSPTRSANGSFPCGVDTRSVGGEDVACGAKGRCRVLVAARLLDGGVLTAPNGELTPGDPTRPNPCDWLCSGGVLGSLIWPN